MAEKLTLEQEQAVAIAKARLRLQQQGSNSQSIDDRNDRGEKESKPSRSKSRSARIDELKSLPGRVMNKISSEADALKAQGWDNLSPAKRAELLALSFPAKFAQVALGVGEQAPGMAARSIPAMVGQRVGEFSRIPGGKQAGGAVGRVGGEYLARYMQNQPMPSLGEVSQAAIEGATTGRPMGRAGASDVLREGARLGAYNTAGEASRQLIDEQSVDPAALGKAFVVGVASSGAEKAFGGKDKSARKAAIKRADNEVLDDTIQKSAEGGYTIMARRGRPSKFEEQTNALVRKDIGAPEDFALSEKNIENHIKELAEPYNKISELSDHAKAQLKGFQDAKTESKRLWAQWEESVSSSKPRPELRNAAKEMDAIAAVFEEDLLTEAKSKGRPDLFIKASQARPKLAKTYLADRAINYARGVADAKVYAKALDNGAPLSGPARTIANAQKANLLKEERIGSLLSRTVTIGKYIASKAEQTSPLQMYLQARPQYSQFPDVAADFSRMSTLQAGNQPNPYFVNRPTE